MQFRLATLFWVMLVFATSMGLAGCVMLELAGPVGIPCALYWLALLWLLPRRKDRTSRAFGFFGVLVALGGFSLFVALTWPAMPRAGEAARRSACCTNLKQIGLGLYDYREKWNHLPPPVTTDASGKPLHSWRTLILPFVEHQPIYSKCDLKLAWNAGTNALLLSQPIPVYECPSDGGNRSPAGDAWTNYVAVVGPGTVWDANAKSPPGDTRIMAVEVSRSGIAWAEPKDLTLDEVLAAAGDDDPQNALPRSEHPGVFFVLCADGSIQAVSNSLPRDVLKTLFTQGFTPEAEREIERGRLERSEENDRRWQQKERLLWMAFAAWLASLVGFGVHAFRVRRPPPAQATESTTAAAASPSQGPPSDTLPSG